MSKHKGGKGVARERKKARMFRRMYFVYGPPEFQLVQWSATADPTSWSEPKQMTGITFVAELHGPCLFVMDQSHWDTLQ